MARINKVWNRTRELTVNKYLKAFKHLDKQILMDV